MKRTQAENLLTIDIMSLSLEELQHYRVKILDAWRESQAEHGYFQAVRDGYMKEIISESASGFSPCNIWLTTNLKQRFEEVGNRLTYLYSNN